MTQAVVEVADRGKVELVPWPENYRNVKTGDFIANINKIRALGWEPRTSLHEGLRATYEYYRSIGPTIGNLQEKRAD